MINIARLDTELPKVFKYNPPSIPSAGVYYFTSDAGVEYEVRFGRKQSNILAVNIVFGALNDEYEGEEYVVTNKGEFYSVMATIIEIIQDFKQKNPNVHTYEFSGEPTDEDRGPHHPTQRTKIYEKWAKKAFPSNEWAYKLQGNRVSIERLQV